MFQAFITTQVASSSLLPARVLGADGADWENVVLVDRQTGAVALRADLVLSDVQAFVGAATRALEPTVGHAERVGAAEEMLALGLPLLGDEDPRVLPADLP